MWALSVRFDPARSTRNQQGAFNTPGPLPPVGAREITSRIIMELVPPLSGKKCQSLD
jgi:hypothetical protein